MAEGFVQLPKQTESIGCMFITEDKDLLPVRCPLQEDARPIDLSEKRFDHQLSKLVVPSVSLVQFAAELIERHTYKPIYVAHHSADGKHYVEVVFSKKGGRGPKYQFSDLCVLFEATAEIALVSLDDRQCNIVLSGLNVKDKAYSTLRLSDQGYLTEKSLSPLMTV